MPKHKVLWINDHIQIRGCLNERVQHMQDYWAGMSDPQ